MWAVPGAIGRGSRIRAARAAGTRLGGPGGTSDFELPDYYLVRGSRPGRKPPARICTLGPLRAVRPAPGLPSRASRTSPGQVRPACLDALRSLEHGPWWPPLDELIDGPPRRFFLRGRPRGDAAGLDITAARLLVLQSSRSSPQVKGGAGVGEGARRRGSRRPSPPLFPGPAAQPQSPAGPPAGTCGYRRGQGHGGARRSASPMLSSRDEPGPPRPRPLADPAPGLSHSTSSGQAGSGARATGRGSRPPPPRPAPPATVVVLPPAQHHPGPCGGFTPAAAAHGVLSSSWRSPRGSSYGCRAHRRRPVARPGRQPHALVAVAIPDRVGDEGSSMVRLGPKPSLAAVRGSVAPRSRRRSGHRRCAQRLGPRPAAPRRAVEDGESYRKARPARPGWAGHDAGPRPRAPGAAVAAGRQIGSITKVLVQSPAHPPARCRPGQARRPAVSR